MPRAESNYYVLHMKVKEKYDEKEEEENGRRRRRRRNQRFKLLLSAKKNINFYTSYIAYSQPFDDILLFTTMKVIQHMAHMHTTHHTYVIIVIISSSKSSQHILRNANDRKSQPYRLCARYEHLPRMTKRAHQYICRHLGEFEMHRKTINEYIMLNLIG